MTVKLFGVLIRFHPLLTVLTAVYLLSGRFSAFLCSFLALALHEGGHLLVLRALRLRVNDIEITPFGGLMEAHGQDALTGGKAFLLAAAGILVNALFAFLSVQAYALSILTFSVAQEFLRANLALLFINLLPVLPLDGGRMAQAVLRRFFDETAVIRWLTVLATVCGLALIAASFLFALRGELLFSPAFSGLYLIYMAASARKSAMSRYITALIGRRQKLSNGVALQVEWLAASEKTPAHTLLSRLSLGKYHMLTVVRDDGRQALGTLDEETLCEGLLSTPSATLGELLSRQNGQS